MSLGDKKNNTFVLNIHDNEIKNSSEVELLDITIDSQLKFKIILIIFAGKHLINPML